MLSGETVIMKRLTQEEFTAHFEREAAIMRARNIFIKSDITNNITVAFELYQKVLAETERPLNAEQIYGKTGLSIFDTLPRIKCDLCEEDMFLRFIPKNEEGILSQGVCSKCNNVLDFALTYEQWIEILKEEDARLKGTNKGTEN